MVPFGTMQPAIAEGTSAARLVEGLAAAVAEKGYAATTIADIVRHARVSKRTFYEHFPDKERCFLAAYQEASARTLAAIAEAVDPSRPFEEQLRAAMRAYLGALEENVTMTRTFLLEIHAAGEPALALRRDIHQRFADQLRSLAAAARAQSPELGTLSRAMARAVVGGINELVLSALAGELPFATVERTATELVRSVLTASR